MGETFIKKIQIEKNPPSPSLVPFLKMANTGTGQSTTPSTTQPTTQQQQQQQNQTALKPGTTQQQLCMVLIGDKFHNKLGVYNNNNEIRVDGGGPNIKINQK